jgi:transcriptional regulator GlxA family with amidase domain
VFKNLIDSTTGYINRFRLEKARTLLLSGNLNISEVPFATGCNDARYFSRLFAGHYGVSPTEMREKT